MQFLTMYGTTDGRRWAGEINAASWEDALSMAADLGHIVCGPIGAKIYLHPETGDQSVDDYPEADTFPRCPKHLLNHPNLERPQ